jgi:hypothetical protein
VERCVRVWDPTRRNDFAMSEPQPYSVALPYLQTKLPMACALRKTREVMARCVPCGLILIRWTGVKPGVVCHWESAEPLKPSFLNGSDVPA